MCKNRQITTTIGGIPLLLETSQELFSPDRIDGGTMALLSRLEFTADDKVLDLGCGYGIVGILAAKTVGQQNVVMSDISEQAIRLSKENAVLNGVPDVKIVQSNGFSSLSDTDFTLILSNPPYHADFSVPKHFIEKGFNRLTIGGKMYMVTKRRDWYQHKFTAIFGGVRVDEVDGYYVFCAEKRSAKYGRKT